MIYDTIWGIIIGQIFLLKKPPDKWAGLQGKQKDSRWQADKNHIKPALTLGSNQQRTIPHRLLPRALSHPQDRPVNAFLGDFDGPDQHLFKEFKTAEECWVLTHVGSSMGNGVLPWGAPNILHGRLCCIPIILHALQTRQRQLAWGLRPVTC